MPAASPFTVARLADITFGAVVTDISLAKLDDDKFSLLYKAWLEHGLLIFPGQHLTADEQIKFARRFGALELDLIPISNVDKDGRVHADSGDSLVKLLKGNLGWHCDSTYMPVQAKGAVFTAEVVPPAGGETAWADMSAAYNALSAAAKEKIAPLKAFHSLHYSQAKLGQSNEEKTQNTGYGFGVKEPPLRPLVKIHPETGRKALAIGRHAFGIPGLGAAEAEQLLEELCDFACQPPRTYIHQWTPGDAVVWDNLRLMHRGHPWDMNQPRVMYHSRIAGHPVTEFAPPGHT